MAKNKETKFLDDLISSLFLENPYFSNFQENPEPLSSLTALYLTKNPELVPQGTTSNLTWVPLYPYFCSYFFVKSARDILRMSKMNKKCCEAPKILHILYLK